MGEALPAADEEAAKVAARGQQQGAYSALAWRAVIVSRQWSGLCCDHLS